MDKHKGYFHGVWLSQKDMERLEALSKGAKISRANVFRVLLRTVRLNEFLNKMSNINFEE